MLMADILHSCTNADIAEAAVASIGSSFAARIHAEAGRSGLFVGALTGSLVSRFAADASERDWRDITLAMSGSDLPVLSGLQAMAERMLVGRERPVRRVPHREGAPMGRPVVPASPISYML